MASFFVVVASLVGAMCVASYPLRSAEAAPFDPEGEDWQGLGDFSAGARGQLGDARVVVSKRLDLGRLAPQDGVLLVHPQRALDVDGLGAFMRAGGRVLVLDDYGTGDALFAHYGVQRVPLPSRPVRMLRGNPALAIAEPAPSHVLVRDVSRVMTNHATGVAHPDLSPVLVVKGDGEPDVLLAVSGSVEKGRLLAVGDGSILINAMMRYPGNRSFALAIARYAIEDDVWGKRGGKLYVLANDFETVGTYGSDSSVEGALNDARRALEEGFESLRHEGMPPVAAYLAAITVCAGVVVWTSRRAGKTHRERTPRFVRAAPIVAQGGVAGHAAIVGAPGTSRVLAVLELKSALEEELATRLGLDKVPPHDELVARVRAANLLGDDDTRALSRLLADLSDIEMTFSMRRRGVVERLSDADVAAIAARARGLLAGSGSATA